MHDLLQKCACLLEACHLLSPVKACEGLSSLLPASGLSSRTPHSCRLLCRHSLPPASGRSRCTSCWSRRLACKACRLGVDGSERIPTLNRLNSGSVSTPARSELGGATLPSRGGCPCPRERLLRRVASPSGCKASCTQAQCSFSRWVISPELARGLPLGGSARPAACAASCMQAQKH